MPPGADYDPRQLQVHRPMPQRDVPYVPSDEAVVAAMLRFANVGPDDVVYDLGCGDGRIVIGAAKQRGARGVGVDIDPLRVRESRENAKKARVCDRVQFLCQSFFDTDVRDATVVMLYLLPSINAKLRPKLLRELRPGARIIANYFPMGDWAPDMRADVHHRVLLQWVVPAWVTGTWRCVVNGPRGRQGMLLRLSRKYQAVTGSARVRGDRGPRELPVVNGRLFADHLTFKLLDPEHRLPTGRYECRVEGNRLRGTCHPYGGEEPPAAWGGVWRG